MMSSLLLAALVLTSPLFAADIALPDDTRFLPLVAPLAADWVLPAGHGKDCKLLVDPKSEPWLGCRGRYLLGPAYGVFSLTERHFDDIAWMGGLGLWAVSGAQLGRLDVAQTLHGGRGADKTPFLPAADFGGGPLRLARAARAGFYVYDRERVFLMTPGKAGWTRTSLLKSRDPITAVAGDGVRTFFAVGRTVIARDARGKPAAVFTHPDADITALEFAPESGLFYATVHGVGFIGASYDFEFLRTPDAQISLHGAVLYVKLVGDRGTLKLQGLEQFRELSRLLVRPD